MQTQQGVMRACLCWAVLVAEVAGTNAISDETCLLQSNSVHLGAADVRAEFLLNANYTPPRHIPCHIHQTWKTNTWDEVPAWAQRSVTSFRAQNPGCEHTLWSDADMNSFIEKKYPQLREVWGDLKPVQRADLFRYAVIHQFCGYYSDVDVECQKPIQDWGMPEGVDLVVGYETGFHLTEEQRKHIGFTRNEQFEQWLFGAKAGHPALQRCLDIFEKKREWGVEKTVELTGPALFSDGVHEFLWQFKPAHHKAGEALDYPPGPGPDGSQTWIFSASQVAYPGATAGSWSFDQVIRHHFQGTWKS